MSKQFFEKIQNKISNGKQQSVTEKQYACAKCDISRY